MLEYYFNKISGLRPAVFLRYYTVIISNFFWTATFKRTNERLLSMSMYCIWSFVRIVKFNKKAVACMSHANNIKVKTIGIS